MKRSIGVLQSCSASGVSATDGQSKSESFPPSMTRVLGHSEMSFSYLSMRSRAEVLVQPKRLWLCMSSSRLSPSRLRNESLQRT